MKFNILLALSFTMSVVFVGAQKKSENNGNIKNVKVVNTLDPICKMKTAMSLSDTAIYKNKTYGFCSKSCKAAFKKNPAKYSK